MSATKEKKDKKAKPEVDKATEEARINEVVQDWTAVLLSTSPMERSEAEESVLELYASAGLKRPMDARLESEKAAGPEIIFCTSVRDYVNKAMEFAHKIKATDAEAKKFTESSAKLAASTPWSDGNWLAADDYYVKYVADKDDKEAMGHPIQHLKKFARNAFALATFEKVAFVIDRPRRIVHREITGNGSERESQWHCTDGPVLEWSDGEKFWAIEGFFCDEQLVMQPKTQTVEQIHNEQNLELRRIRIERKGWKEYLAESGAKVLDKRRNDIDGGCYEMLCDAPGLEARVLLCTCPTGRVFNLLVPNDTGTCQAAKDYLKGDPRLAEIGRT